MTTDLQRMIHDLQVSPDVQNDDALQRLCQTLQTELYSFEQRPQRQISVPVQLTPEQQRTWISFQAFLQMLCEYAGWVNRDQWLMLLDIAADIISRGPPGDTPYINPDTGTWWIADQDTGVHASGQPAFVGVNGNWWLAEPPTDTGISATGPAGANGVPGPQGVPGTGLNVIGQFDTAAQLLAAQPNGPAQEGGAYLVGVTDPKHLFLWFNNSWHDVGPLTGVGIAEAPNDGQEYVRNGLTQNWDPITHDGGSW